MADTIPGNTTSTQSLPIGGSTTSVVDAAWDNDWFKVDLVKGVTYEFELKGVDGGGGTLADPWLKLFSANGIILGTDDDGTAVYDQLASHSHDSQLIFLPQESGVYFIDATGFAGVAGTYTLSATTLTAEYYIQSVLAQPTVRWNGGQPLGTPVTVTYCFPTTKPTDFGSSQTTGFGALSATQRAIVRAALGEIEALVNIHFQEMSGSSGSIRFATTNQGTTSNGVTYWSTSAPSTLSQADVALNSASSGISDWTPGSYMYKTLVHEIGHALGLKHPGNYNGVSGTAALPYLPSSQDASPYTIESYNNSTSYLGFTSNGYLYAKTMMGFDIAALQYLYGKNTSAHTGSDTYAFDSKALYSIWDAGGVDTLDGSTETSSVTLDLGQGQISYTGLVGTDTIGRGLAPGFSIAFGTDIENATGSAYADLLIGNSLGNTISGGGGSDLIQGYAGDDSLSGGSGNDTLSGDAGNDHLDGGDGNDILYGGDGNDVFDWDAAARGGNDTFYGGAGSDVYVLNSPLDSVIEYSGEGTDTVWVNFSYSIAYLSNIENLSAFGTTGVSVTGNAANNRLDGTSANDTIDGGTGIDTVSYSGARASYTIAWITGGATITSTVDGIDTLKSVEFASFLDQTISLTPALSGGAGNDILTGTAGADLIYGNGGDDRINGMGGGDSIYGGSGIDTVVFAYDSGDYLVSKNPTTGSYEVISKTGAIDYVDADVEKMVFRDITVDAASYKYYGTTDPVLAGSVSSVYRFFNTNDNAFFYTNSVTERDTVLANSDVSHNNVGEWPYVYQGSSFEAAHTYAGAVPLERFYNTVTHHHFFTSSATEAATVKANREVAPLV